jgi:hypothetical protein
MGGYSANSDPDDWTKADVIDRTFSDYQPSPHEKKTIELVRTNLQKKLYKDKKSTFGHMQILEHLSNKYKEIIANERSIGRENWDVEQAYKEISMLYQELINLYRQFK